MCKSCWLRGSGRGGCAGTTRLTQRTGGDERAWMDAAASGVIGTATMDADRDGAGRIAAVLRTRGPALLVVLGVALLLATRAWHPIAGLGNADIAGILYEADLICDGGVPYVDTFDMKSPGSWFLFAAIFCGPGSGWWGGRAIEAVAAAGGAGDLAGGAQPVWTRAAGRGGGAAVSAGGRVVRPQLLGVDDDAVRVGVRGAVAGAARALVGASAGRRGRGAGGGDQGQCVRGGAVLRGGVVVGAAAW